jgi:pimeloyl-ACP methyl ester carboxylesterase
MNPAVDIQTVEVRTSLGLIPLTGTFGRTITTLAINGAFARADEMHRLPLVVAPYGGVVGFLPGDRNPPLAETSVSAFAWAFDEVVDQLGPTVVMGLSIGGLVALAMRSPNIRRVIAVEPPLVTGKLWPMATMLGGAWTSHHRNLVENVFGLSPDGFPGRDYSGLLEGLHRPTDVVLGDEPLFPVRTLERWPSFVDEPERALLRAHPLVKVHLAPAGHNVPFHAPQVLLPILLAAMEAEAV